MVDAELAAVLASASLSHLTQKLADASLDGLVQAAADDRTKLLARLKAVDGVEKLSDRQKLANTLCKLARERGIEASPAAAAARAEKTKIVLPTGAVALHGRGFTISGKTDGFGAQLQAQMSGIAYSQRHAGQVYVHSPMGPKMDHELHGVSGDVGAAELDAFGGMASGSPVFEAVVVDDVTRARVEWREYAREVHDAPTAAAVGEYYSDSTRALLRAKYASTPKPELPACCCGVSRADDAAAAPPPPSYVAIHIRRGDVTADAHPRRFTPNAAYMPLLAALAAAHPNMPMVIFSQGPPEAFADLCASLGAERRVALCLDEDLRVTFNALVNATALLVARSSFSYSAAILNRGAVYCDLLDGWWHQPLPSWRRCSLEQRSSRVTSSVELT